MTTETTTIEVSKVTHKRLQKRASYLDTMDIVVKDLLDKVEQIEK